MFLFHLMRFLGFLDCRWIRGCSSASSGRVGLDCGRPGCRKNQRCCNRVHSLTSVASIMCYFLAIVASTVNIGLEIGCYQVVKMNQGGVTFDCRRNAVGPEVANPLGLGSLHTQICEIMTPIVCYSSSRLTSSPYDQRLACARAPEQDTSAGPRIAVLVVAIRPIQCWMWEWVKSRGR